VLLLLLLLARRITSSVLLGQLVDILQGLQQLHWGKLQQIPQQLDHLPTVQVPAHPLTQCPLLWRVLRGSGIDSCSF